MGSQKRNAASSEVSDGSDVSTADTSRASSLAKPDTSKATQRDNEMLIDGMLYDISNFKHPGGTIIGFYKGHGDATATFKQFHIRSQKAEKMLKALKSRPCPAEEAALWSRNDALAKDFQKLHDDFVAEGFFNRDVGEIVWRFSEIFLMFAAGFYLLLGCNATVLRALGVLVIGLAQGRCGWLMHEGGHGSLTGNIKVDRAAQIVLYGLGCGMSAGWWRSQHNKHHAAPQKLKHDADLDTLPLLAFNAAVTKHVRSPLLKAWLQAQAYLFLPLTCLLVVLGWQFFLHPRYMIRTSKWSELATLCLRYYAIFAWAMSGWSWSSAILCYVLVQQVGGAYIFANFALSHTHLDVTQPDEFIHWVEYSANHTTNLSNHWLVNWWMAHLNFQIEHHLFPAMPQFRHPIVSERVRALFQKHGLKYDVRGYFSCLGDTLRNLHEVGHSDSKRD